MKAIHSPLSPIQMITALETIQSLLENYPCSLSGYEKSCLTIFATLAAESMEKKHPGHIIISLFSGTQAASMGRLELTRLRVVNNALSSLIPGDVGKYFSAHSSNLPQRISLATSLKNGPLTRSCTIVLPNS